MRFGPVPALSNPIALSQNGDKACNQGSPSQKCPHLHNFELIPIPCKWAFTHPLDWIRRLGWLKCIFFQPLNY